MMNDGHDEPESSRELGGADTGRSGSEIPMPEQGTGDMQPSPNKTPGEYQENANPVNPPSDRA
jgi:hypothetical protein